MTLATAVLLIIAQAAPLEEQLRREDPAALASAAEREGDPVRGALLFHQPHLTCLKCHEPGGESLGPDLTRLGSEITARHVVEAILEPSRAIKKGFETVRIVTADGRVFAGLLVEESPERITLRDPTRPDKPIEIARDQVEERDANGPSLMPAGLVGGLTTRGQFLDLVAYVLEIGRKGLARALELRPEPSLVQAPPLPEYENDLDHAGLIAGWGPASLRRGEAIYHRVCANCHGTKDHPGSLPTAPRFATAELRNGADPYSLYRTLTHGYGLMVPQTWMVPRQKYDVIHYLREHFFKDSDRGAYTTVDADYLATLPRGFQAGPDPPASEPWAAMDYGPYLAATYEVGDDGTNVAYKGLAIRLDSGPGGVSRGRAWVVYDQDTLRLAAGWTGSEFIDWHGIHFDGQHAVHPRIVGTVRFANPDGPGWARPADGSWDDPRLRGRDGRPYGPLPADWGRMKRLYRSGDRVVLEYNVGTALVREMPGLEGDADHPERAVFTRTFNVGRSDRDLTVRLAGGAGAVVIAGGRGATLSRESGEWRLTIPAAVTPMNVKAFIGTTSEDVTAARDRTVGPQAADLDLGPYLRGGPARWPEELSTEALRAAGGGPFAVESLVVPERNPWSCLIRPGGFDFLPDGDRAALATWDGDVWLVTGLLDPRGALRWRRIASGLFQPLGVRVVGDRIHVACRDRIAVLEDLDGDLEADVIATFNTDHQVTDHFHEFAMDLQTDQLGNFYYAKAARHALPALVPQHGTLLRVSPDGSRTDILATGFRAPNGVCLNPDGTFFVTDQEGHWTPKNRINWVRPGRFYGNMWGYHDVTDPSDDAMEPPLCWITNAVDRSPSQLLRVERPEWGVLRGSLLSLSYGYGKIFVVPHERVDDRMQGGVTELPIAPFPTGLIRGRFHPKTGDLYVCGLYAWAGSQTLGGGFYRIRPTGEPPHVPIGLHARRTGMELVFSAPLDPRSVADQRNFAVKTWSLRRTANYGSPHLDERPLTVSAARLAEDGRTVELTLPGIAPCWSMEIVYALRSADGRPVQGRIHNTIHELPR